MDKETLIRLAQPTATFALAISIISYPVLVKSGLTDYYGGSSNPIHIKCVGGCK